MIHPSRKRTKTARSDSYTTVTATNTGQTCDHECQDCTIGCLQTFYITPFLTVSYCVNDNNTNYSDPHRDPYGEPTYTEPDTTDHVVPDPICWETLKEWREESKRISKLKFKPINKLPRLLRRMNYSKSGWLARKGRLRKKGKK